MSQIPIYMYKVDNLRSWRPQGLGKINQLLKKVPYS